MDERTLEKNEAIQKMLKSEYDLAKRECEYYTQEFNKQDTILILIRCGNAPILWPRV